MSEWRRYLGQAVLYGVFFLPLLWLTHEPQYRLVGEDTAVLKLAIRHAGQIVGECTDVSVADRGNLPVNMQLPQTCPRERSSLQLELLLDGKTLYRDTIAASGLHSDGISSMYSEFQVPAGQHALQIRMNDDTKVDGPTWTLDEQIDLVPAQVLVASFKQGFRLQ
jgi:hypothetical protein